MKLSLRFFYTKIAQHHPTATMKITEGAMPTFSSLGIITDSLLLSDEIIYIDLIALQEKNLPTHASVVTTQSRASLFTSCNTIVLPDNADLSKIVELISKTFTHYFGWADAIYDAIAKNMDIQTIIDLTTTIIKNPLYITDSSFKMLASWGGDFGEVNPTWRYQERYRYLPYQIMQNLIDSGELKKLYHTPQAWLIKNSQGFEALPFISKAIRKDGIHYGNFFIIELYDFLDACDLEIADYLGMVLSTSLQGNLNYLETSTLYHAHFLEDIIEGTLTDERIMIDQLKALKWDIEGDFLLVLFETNKDNDAIRHHMMMFLSTDLTAQCFEYQGNILVILNNCTDKKEKIITHLQKIARNFNRMGAVSEQFSNFSHIGFYYAQACFALKVASARRSEERLISYSQVFLEHLIEKISKDIPPCTAAVALKRYDETQGTTYCTTLLTWLMRERNNVDTAQALFIHRNTLRNQLKKIEEIIGISLDDFEVRERLLISLYAFKQEIS